MFKLPFYLFLRKKLISFWCSLHTVKPALNGHSQKDQKLVFKTNYCLMQVKSIAECSFDLLKLPFVIKIFVLSIFEWPFYTGFTVYANREVSDRTAVNDSLTREPSICCYQFQSCL